MKILKFRKSYLILMGTAVVLLLLLIAFYSWLAYRKQQSFEVPVHKNAEAFIRINLDQILKTLAIDEIAPPWNFEESKERKQRQEVATGIDIPANFLAYTVKDDDQFTLYGYLKINDLSSFKRFIKSKLEMERSKTMADGKVYAFSRTSRLALLFNKNEVAFAYSPFDSPSQDLTVLKDILSRKNTLPSSDQQLESLEEMTGHIAFFDPSKRGAVDFLDGKITIDLEFPAHSLDIPDKVFHRKFKEKSSVKGWAHAAFRKGMMPEAPFLTNIFNLNPDSLVSYYGGYVDLEFRDSVKQIDTVVTYTYDDDFEKVAEKSIQEKHVPEVYLTLGNKNALLVNYLKRQGLLDETLSVKRAVFPLFRIYGVEHKDYLQLMTGESNALKFKEVSTEYFLYLAININEIRQKHQLHAIDKYLPSVDSIVVASKKAGANRARLEGNIYLSDSEKNALTQLDLW